MKRQFRLTLHSIALASLLTGTFAGAAAFAQERGGPPPGPGFGGPQGRGFGPGGPQGRGPRQASIANIPADTLAAGLKLSAEQKTKIASIQKQLQQQRESLMPRRGGRGEQPGGPPDFEAMRANMEKMRSQEQAAVQNIEAVLTASQKQALPAFLKELDALREVGIPAEVYGNLKLTTDQKTKIVAIGQQAQQGMRERMEAARESGDFGAVREAMEQSRHQTHEKAMAVLTAAQRSAVEKYIEAHPRPERGPGFGPGGPGGRGGFGGPGGPPPGGFGGPPPGGFDGPPPAAL